MRINQTAVNIQSETAVTWLQHFSEIALHWNQKYFCCFSTAINVGPPTFIREVLMWLCSFILTIDTMWKMQSSCDQISLFCRLSTLVSHQNFEQLAERIPNMPLGPFCCRCGEVRHLLNNKMKISQTSHLFVVQTQRSHFQHPPMNRRKVVSFPLCPVFVT